MLAPMKLAAVISALGLLALVSAAPRDALADPGHGRGGDSRPHGRFDEGPRGGRDDRGHEDHGRGGPHGGPYGQGGGYSPYGQSYGGRPPYSQPGGGQYRPPARRVPLETVVGQMRRRFPGGHLLDADMQDRNGRAVYHVHWATGDGRRVDYIVDAETGQILGEED